MNRVILCALAALTLLGSEAVAQSFGRAVAIAGTDILVGEPNSEATGGTVYVYRKTAGKWTETAALRASDGASSDGFGTQVAASGNLLLASAPRREENKGAVYLFQRDARGNWSQVARFTADDGTPAQNFGNALAVSADIALVGAPTQNMQTGAVYVYRRSGDDWKQEARLLSPGAKSQGFFGQAVAISGDRVLVGEPGANERTGVVHVFARQGSEWKAVGKLESTQPQKNDRFGATLAAGGDRVYVGLPGFSSSAGAVDAFVRNTQGEFTAAGRHTAGDAVTTPDIFSAAMAADGNRVWIGAPRANQARGAVYQYEGSPQPAAKLNAQNGAPSDFFGGAIAARGDLLAVGAFNDDFGLGSVVVYEAGTPAGVLSRPDQRMASKASGKVECNNGKADAFACNGVDLMSFMSVADMWGGRGVGLSGIWGWTDPETNREYALVGRMDGTAFVDVTNPANPRYLGDLPLTPGANPSPWREIKTYKNYMLVSADGAGAHGLQIFDLEQLRDVKTPKSFAATVTYKRVNSVHNVVVNEESGFAYAVGSSSGGETCGGGLHMIDMKNPLDPQFAGCFADPQTGRASTGYSHDALCVVYKGPDKDHQNKEICLGANETMLSIADVTDKKNPKALSRAAYPKVGYLHQGWFTKDGRYFFMNDELDEVSGLVQNTRTLIWDLADLDDPQMVGEFNSPTTASDHNLYINGDLMYQSHYKAGVRLVDVSDPLKPVEIGFFDTAPTQPDTPGFAGSWGNYPFFKSGTWIASSINEGLFVLKKQDKKPVL